MTDDTTPLRDAAVQMHELVMEYIAAGFTRAEAVQIVIAVATAGIRPES